MGVETGRRLRPYGWLLAAVLPLALQLWPADREMREWPGREDGWIVLDDAVRERLAVERESAGDAPTDGAARLPDEPEPSAPSGRIDLNRAGLKELRSLPGIGETRARAIIEWRTKRGGFKSAEELDDVPGIGPATMDKLRPLVYVGE